MVDSADPLRRTRGRRGLEMLSMLQQTVPIEIVERDPEDIAQVDAKLVRLAQERGAKLVTNDYNLNRVAQVEGVSVLNINELANAVKPVLLPGEELRVAVIREGREAHQGVGYLDDGTMIVIENGRRMIGDVDRFADHAAAVLDHDHRPVVEVTDALMRLAAFADDGDAQLLTGKQHRLDRVRELVDVENGDALHLCDPVEVVVVGHQLGAALLCEPYQLGIDLRDVLGIALDDLDRNRLLEHREHLEPTPAARAPQRVGAVGDQL